MKEAGNMSGVASASGLLYFEEQRVFITVDVPADDALSVAAGFAFEPVFLPRTTPVVHEPGFNCALDRVVIHPRHHQYSLGIRILDNRWDEAVGIVFELLHTAHADLMKVKTPKEYQTYPLLVHCKVIDASTCLAN